MSTDHGRDRYLDSEIAIARLQERVLAGEAALRIAAVDVNRRLDEMNGLRTQIEQERSGYVTRQAYDQRHEEVTRRLDTLERWQANVTGRAIGLGLVGGVLVAVVAAVVTHLVAS